MKRLLLITLSLFLTLQLAAAENPRQRVIISTDIGGTDPDDFQSMVHLLLYSDVLDIEGLIASPFGLGRKQHILDIIDLYEKDFANLSSHSANYPTPTALRAITKQGAIDVAPYQGFQMPTEGSRWIIERARAKDPRPLHLLVWGGIEDLAQALHDAPDILPKLRVYYIGGPNKKWTPDTYHYLATQHPNLWIIETNATYRGWFEGGDQSGGWGNQSFVEHHIAPHGELGKYFSSTLGGTIKMGDTPSVAWMLQGNTLDPSQPGWGGQFVRAWTRPYTTFDRLTTAQDTIEEFSIAEFVLPLGNNVPNKPQVKMLVENQLLTAFIDQKNYAHFRFSPKAAKIFTYSLQSNVATLDGKTGAITATPTPIDAASRPDAHWPNWWVDNPAPEFSEGPHIGAKTVSRWRKDYLSDFAQRMRRASTPATTLNSSKNEKNWGKHYLHFSAHWYASDEARRFTRNLINYQSAEGAWPKNVDFSIKVTPKLLEQIVADGKANTIDNEATTVPLRFMALMFQATGDEKYRAAFNRGLDYLLAAQYENGGWPQFYPLRQDGYYSHITFNDNAMVNVLFLLRDISDENPLFKFIDKQRKQQSALAVARGIDCILKTQIKNNNRLTAWAAQYDETTLQPAWARKYEPPSLSGAESVDIVRFLLAIEQPTAEQISAIEGAIKWFEMVAIKGYRYQSELINGVRDARIVADATAADIWARFYELDTNRPIFLGRDSVTHYALAEIEQERRGGYRYYGTWAATLLSEDCPQWKAKHKAKL